MCRTKIRLASLPRRQFRLRFINSRKARASRACARKRLLNERKERVGRKEYFSARSLQSDNNRAVALKGRFFGEMCIICHASVRKLCLSLSVLYTHTSHANFRLYTYTGPHMWPEKSGYLYVHIRCGRQLWFFP